MAFTVAAASSAKPAYEYFSRGSPPSFDAGTTVRSRPADEKRKDYSLDRVIPELELEKFKAEETFTRDRPKWKRAIEYKCISGLLVPKKTHWEWRR